MSRLFFLPMAQTLRQSMLHRRLRAVLFFCLLCCSSVSTSIRADTTLVMASETASHTFKVRGDQILITENSLEESSDQTILYDRAKQKLVIMNPTKKTFLKLEAAKLEEIEATVKGVLTGLDQHLADLDLPATEDAQGSEAEGGGQKEALLGLLRGALGEIDTKKLKKSQKTYTLREKTSRIAQWDCNVVDKRNKGRREAAFYLVPREALDIPEEDYATLASLETFTSDLLTALPVSDSILTAIGPPDLHFPDGQIPIRTINYSGEEKVVSQITEVSFDALNPTDFLVPDDYTERSLDLPF